MSNASANAPCPCGSGKKHKRCCRDRGSAYQRAIDAQEHRRQEILERATWSREDQLLYWRWVDAFERKAHNDAAAALMLLPLLAATAPIRVRSRRRG